MQKLLDGLPQGLKRTIEKLGENHRITFLLSAVVQTRALYLRTFWIGQPPADGREEFVQVRSDLKVMQWMTGTIVVGVVALVARSFF